MCSTIFVSVCIRSVYFIFYRHQETVTLMCKRNDFERHCFNYPPSHAISVHETLPKLQAHVLQLSGNVSPCEYCLPLYVQPAMIDNIHF